MEIEQQRNEAQRVLNEITDEINERKKQIEELPVSAYFEYITID